jgi:hypothetical protein
MSNSQQAKQHMTKVMMSDAAREIKDVQVKDLSAWDRASIRKAQELQNSVELEEFRNQIKRIFELAGSSRSTVALGSVLDDNFSMSRVSSQ